MKLTAHDLPIGRAKCSAIFLPESAEPDLHGQYRPINPHLILSRKRGIPKQTFYTRLHRGMDALLAATLPAQSHSEVARRQGRDFMDRRLSALEGIAMDQWLASIKQAASLLGCDRSSVTRRMDDGSIPWVWLGSRRMVHLGKLREQIDADAPASQYSGASGVSIGEKAACHTNDPARHIGGSVSHRREAASRLENLLGR